MSFWIAFIILLGEVSCSSDLLDRYAVPIANDKVLAEVDIQKVFPLLKPNCAKDALDPFLPLCLTQGMEAVDTELRVQTAVKLSICEFRASGLNHVPDACLSEYIDDMMECMIEMETSAQWWTTYSGNFQRLSSICTENALPYEKEQILNLFLNITGYYQEVNDKMEQRFHDMILNMDLTSEVQISKLLQMFEEYTSRFTNTAKSQHDYMENEFRTSMELMVQDDGLLRQKFQERNNDIEQSLGQLYGMIQVINEELIGTDTIGKVYDLRNQTVNDVSQIKNMTNELLKVHSNLQQTLEKEVNTLAENAIDKFGTAVDAMSRSQLESLQTLQEFDSLIQNSIAPALYDDLLPQITDYRMYMLEEWNLLQSAIFEDISKWNLSLFAVLDQVSLTVDNTNTKVERLHKALDRFYSNFSMLLTFLQSCKRAICITYKFFSRNSLYGIGPFGAYLAMVLLRQCCSNPRSTTFLLSTEIMLKMLITLAAIYLGSHCGTLLLSICHAVPVQVTQPNFYHQ